MSGQPKNITMKKLAKVVERPEQGLSQSIRQIMREWSEAGICPKIVRGVVVDEMV